ncbi:MAG: 50S ribosomal protein L28 [Buchnera aphidicola (Brevicoryne brassicae)]|uniref:Large ribosomal subunit protein bL28 n=1 Tax=Buchnera aphidicola (Brevicoryne brassicae) TaxID=911343 RepID=A0AAJ5PUQ7_9GAMM|nr:50S ribosomal protein L28 [Buchnera aphidicola]QCI19668.1 50S ribosomal protein L28 [Buchnera aphidicola (Brevicoryne brassicae)]WAI19036.1 MAG: 50S ribosomal protein L28 [Buchnera aphidicola (Brevicoryne brassicae)]
MSRICQITGKKRMIGNNRSHAMNATKRKFLINIQYHRFWIADEKRFIKLRISANGMRYINKKGIETILKEIKDK